MSDENVVIDLSQNETSILETSATQIQQNAYKKLRKKIQDQVISIGEFSYKDIKDTDIIYPRAHNAILIEGTRGSGKTTFLLKSLERLKEDEILKLSVLRLIDPTLIETKENIVVVILSAIDTALNDVKGDARSLNDAREALAEGLGLLDGIGSPSAYGAEWEDAKWVMSQGLRKAQKGRDFEKKLGAYIEQALKLINKKAFILTFDDVDTNFSHGHTILETVRKYLTHPGLIIILSGDLELYGRLLRKNIYLSFGDQLLDRDSGVMDLSKKSIGDAILELEEQYLLKIAPPQNRISMIPLGRLRKSSGGHIELLLSKSPANKSLKVETWKWTNDSICELMHETSRAESHPFFNLLSMEPMRLVIGYLRALDNLSDSRYSAIFTTFSTRLQAKGVSADAFIKGDLDSTIRATFEWMYRQKDAPDLLRFGVSADASQAIVVHCLALSMAQRLKGHAGNVLKALLGFALPLAMMRRPMLLGLEERTALFRFLWSQSTVTASELAARLCAVDRANERANTLKGSSFGSVGLTNKVETKNILDAWYGITQERLYIKQAKSIDSKPAQSSEWLSLFENNTTTLIVRNGTGWLFIDDLIEVRCGKFGEILRLPVSKRFNERGEVMRSISALSLFGVIADFLSAGNIDDFDTFGQYDISTPFESKSNNPNITDLEPDDDDDLDHGEDSELLNLEAYEAFKKAMNSWHEYARSLELKISPNLLGRIALRIHDDLLSLDEKMTNRWRTGEILHRQIICILHGVLATSSSVQGRKETSKTSDQAFVDLLRKFSNEQMPALAAALLSCPLVWVFLNPKGLGCKQNLSVVTDNALAQMASSSYAPEAYKNGNTYEYLSILVGPTKDSAYKVDIVSFYQLLNVVPRYAAK